MATPNDLIARLGFGEREPRRREALRHLRVQRFEFGEPLQAEHVGGDRQQAQSRNEQDGFRRDR